MSIKNGDVLKNGATVLENKRQEDGSLVVLCMWPKSDKVEYVTWYANDEINACYWGHYFDSLSDAMSDYESRGGV